MDLDSIISILSYAIPILLAWLIKSPIGKHIPPVVADVLSRLQPGDIETLYDGVKSREARRETAMNYLITECAKRGIYIDDVAAGSLVDYFAKVYRSVVR